MNLKKPKFWDYKSPNIFAYFLLPLTIVLRIYNLLKIQTVCAKTKIKKICVGNIYLGGTGKTSLSIKINQILNKRKLKSCFIKKFYRNQIDEQRILKNNGKLFLSSQRIIALREAENEKFEFAIFDDGLQDKSLEYDVSFVCFNNINFIGNGMTIPSGPLREPLNILKKYNNVFFNGNLENIENLKEQILEINPQINIHIGIYEPINLKEFSLKDNYFVFSGIGNHQTFVSMLKNSGLIILKDIEFPDHYKYFKKDLEIIINQAKKLNCKIITTEKDYKRFENFNFSEIKFIKSKLKIVDEERFVKSILLI